MKKLLIFLILIPGSLLAMETILLDDNWSPQSYYDKFKKPTGLQYDVVTELFRRMNVPAEVKLLPWKRAQKSAMEHDSWIGTIYKTEEREKTLLYSEPLTPSFIHLYVLKERYPDIQGTLEELQRFHLVTAGIGWSYGSKIDSMIKDGLVKVKRVRGADHMIKQLLNRNVDAALISIAEADAVLNRISQEISRTVIRSPQSLENLSIYLATARQWRKHDLLEKVNATIEEMTADGTMQLLQDKYLK